MIFLLHTITSMVLPPAVDLRSDTVTTPTKAMSSAMAAEAGRASAVVAAGGASSTSSTSIGARPGDRRGTRRGWDQLDFRWGHDDERHSVAADASFNAGDPRVRPGPQHAATGREAGGCAV